LARLAGRELGRGLVLIRAEELHDLPIELLPGAAIEVGDRLFRLRAFFTPRRGG
jgi:hypothetical protein